MAEMTRRRSFTVEQARRKEAMDPHVRCRKLALAALHLGGAALGEMNGAQPDASGSARWDLIRFNDELAHGSRAVAPALSDPGGRQAWALLVSAGRAFIAASSRRRRAFAPALIAAAQLVEDFFQEQRG